MSIFNNTANDLDDDWFWANANVGTGIQSAQRPNPSVAFTNTMENYDFRLVATVPEPGTLLLMSLGLAVFLMRWCFDWHADAHYADGRAPDWIKNSGTVLEVIIGIVGTVLTIVPGSSKW